MAADEIWSDPIPTTVGHSFTVSNPSNGKRVLTIVAPKTVGMSFNTTYGTVGIGIDGGGGGNVCEDDRPETGMLYPRG